LALSRFKKYFLNDNPVVTKTKIKKGKLPFILNLKSVLGLDSKVPANEIPGTPVTPFEYEYDENKDIPFYSNISEEALSNLLKKCKTIRYLYNGTITINPNQTDSVYIIFAGRVNLESGDSKRTFVIQDDFTSLKEIAVISDDLLSAHWIKLDRTMFAHVTKPEFDSWLTSYPNTGFNVM
jgi:hypothetical protein